MEKITNVLLQTVAVIF